jgi:hypothetical protein
MAEDKKARQAALRAARMRLVEYRLEVAKGFADAITEPQLDLLYKAHRAIEIVDATIKETEVFRSARWDDSV